MAHGRDAAYTPRQMSTQPHAPGIMIAAVAALASAGTALYPPSWVNILIDRIDRIDRIERIDRIARIDRIERLPGPPWVAYVAALGPLVLLVSLQDWVSGAPIDGICADRAVWAFALIGSLWLVHHLDGVARRAMQEFAGTLNAEPGSLAGLEYELTVIPARTGIILLVLSAVRTAEAFAFQPESEGIVGLAPVMLGIRWVFEVMMTSLIMVLIYHTIRQLRLVGRIHAMAPVISLFRPAPLYACSRLTSRTAIGLVLLVIPFTGSLALAVSAFDYLTILTLMGLILGTASLAFGLPLVGMHQRMNREKQRLEAEVGARIEALIDDLHGSLDRRDLSAADGQNKKLARLVTERDLVRRMSTWPWQAGTAGAVMSAVLLPIALWLVTRVMERIL